MELAWTTPARRDLERIWHFNASRNIDRADRIEDMLIASAVGLLQRPGKGRPGDLEGTRILSITAIQYVLSYSVGADAVSILRIWSSAERR